MLQHNNKSTSLTKAGRRGLFAAMALPKTDRQPTAGALPAAAERAGVLQLVGMPGHFLNQMRWIAQLSGTPQATAGCPFAGCFMKAVPKHSGAMRSGDEAPNVACELGNGLDEIPVGQRRGRKKQMAARRLGWRIAFMKCLGACLTFNRWGLIGSRRAGDALGHRRGVFECGVAFVF